jgi:hypothetical protein
VAKKKSISQQRKAKSDKNPKGIAKGCGMVLENKDVLAIKVAR